MGCSDIPSTTEIAVSPAISSPRLATVAGTVMTNSAGYKGTALMLRLDDGSTIGLTGDQAAAMYSVVDAQVEVDGQIDGTSMMLVQRFIVTSVGGQPVLDGVLDLTPDGFILRLTRGGDRGVMGASDDLQQIIGDRLCLAGPTTLLRRRSSPLIDERGQLLWGAAPVSVANELRDLRPRRTLVEPCADPTTRTHIRRLEIFVGSCA